MSESGIMSIFKDNNIYAMVIVQSVVFLFALYLFVFTYSQPLGSTEILYSPLFHVALLVSSGWLFVVGIILYILNKVLSLQQFNNRPKSKEEIERELESVKDAKEKTEEDYYKRKISEKNFKESMREYYRKIKELRARIKEENE